MMKKKLLSLILGFLFLGFFVLPAQASFMVPSFGETGWQSYSYTSPGGFTGNANWLVANTFDAVFDPVLLLDNLSQNAAGNRGFETGDFTGYTLALGSGGYVTNSYYSSQGTLYLPVKGSYFSAQYTSYDGDYNANAFTNYTGDAGTDGSFLSSPINLPAGGKFTFDWAFLANDYTPFTDFAAFYLTDQIGQVIHYDVLAQIGPVDSLTQVGNTFAAPINSTLLLFGTGLLCMMGRRQNLSKVY